MQTDMPDELLATSQGQRANDILRSCVHCGFCNATCPTYQVTGDELDGPRGRIYLIRELLQSGDNAERATQHLDRCLTCRACETTCPSGVAYGELAEIARNHIGPDRSGGAGRLRRLLQWMVPDAARLRRLSRLGRPFRWMLPAVLARQVPARVGRGVGSVGVHARKVVLLNGCAQQVTTPATNEHLAALLDAHGISVVTAPDEGCCGSLDLHLGDESRALQRIRDNVDALMPLLGETQAIISTASGCGVTIKDYGRLLAHDPLYAPLAKQVSERVVDAAEYLRDAGLQLGAALPGQRVAWHAPCTLQHGQQITGVVEDLLTAAGYELATVRDSHLCCGSAGTYSVLQPDLSETLAERKLEALCAGQPDVIASANVGCQTHLQGKSSVPVMHWVQLLQ